MKHFARGAHHSIEKLTRNLYICVLTLDKLSLILLIFFMNVELIKISPVEGLILISQWLTFFMHTELINISPVVGLILNSHVD